jgi:LysM repeat protein
MHATFTGIGRKMKHLLAYILAMIVLIASASALAAQSETELQRISDLEQDVQALKEKVGQMNIQMEAIQRENDALKTQLAAAPAAGTAAVAGAGYVTTTQLDAQLANLRAEMMRAQTAQKDEIVDEVGKQMERLAQQTQQAIQSQATSSDSGSRVSDNIPKTGIAYTVQKGDTLSGIAHRFNASIDDIRNANNISDSGRIMVGQKLFIPQRASKTSSKK